MNEFWHTVNELEPPIGKTVWTTTDPFKSIPVIRSDSWNGPGTGWRHHGFGKNVYWAFPISKKASNKA